MKTNDKDASQVKDLFFGYRFYLLTSYRSKNILYSLGNEIKCIVQKTVPFCTKHEKYKSLGYLSHKINTTQKDEPFQISCDGLTLKNFRNF